MRAKVITVSDQASSHISPSLGGLAAATVVASALATVLERSAAFMLQESAALSPFATFVLFGGELVLSCAWFVVLALGAGIARVLVHRFRDDAHERAQKRVFRAVWASTAALAAGAFAVPVAEALFRGPWISAQPVAEVGPSVMVLLATIGIGALCATWCSGWWLRHRTLASAAGLLFAALAITADVAVFPGLYDQAHMALHAVAALLLLFTSHTLIAPLLTRIPRRDRIPLALRLLVFVGCAGATWFLANASTRAELVRGSVAATPFVYLMPKSGDAQERLPVPQILRANSARQADEPGIVASWRNPRYNIVLIVVDTLRADALWPLLTSDAGFAAPEDTPFLNQWLREAVVFTRAYAQASSTKRSMPAMFRSLRSWEEPTSSGVPLGEAMAMLGRETLAVTNVWFFEGRQPRARQMLDGFAKVAIYDSREQNTTKLAAELLSRIDRRPFFAWIHYYAMHSPGYDGRLQSRRLPAKQRYRNSLRWLDGELRELHEHLAQTGQLEETVVVLASDHGEALGANDRRAHGTTVYEEEVRVPLAMWIPGVEPRRVDHVVSNLDLLPTLFDLLGEQRPHHRGESLLKRIAERSSPVHARYIEERTGEIAALVREHDKLIFDRRGELFQRFELRSDPREDADLYGEDPVLERELEAELFLRNPTLYGHASRGEPELLTPALSSPSPHELHLALNADRAGAEERLGEYVAQNFRAFDETSQLVMLDRLRDLKTIDWDEILRQHLRALSPKQRMHFVRMLAHQGQGRFAPHYVAAQIAELAQAEPDVLEPWLYLISRWDMREMSVGPALASVLERSDLPPRVRALVLQNLASLEPDESLAEPLRPHARRSLEHPDARVRRAALAVVSTLADGDARATAMKRLQASDEDLLVRREAMRCLASFGQPEDIAAIARAGRDARLTWSAVEALERLDTPHAAPFLRWAAKHHYNSFVRSRAKKAWQRVRSQPAP